MTDSLAGAIVEVGSQKQLVVVQGSAQLALLQQRRDDFEMVADGQFFHKLVKIGSYLEALRYYRRGADRHRVFTFSFIRDAFARALCAIGVELFNVDQWYFDMLDTLEDRDEAETARFKEPDPNRVHELASHRGEHKIDWIGTLQRLEDKWPGFVNAFYSSIEQQNDTQATAIEEYRRAMDYARGSEAPANMGKHVMHSAKAPQARSTRGGQVLGHY